MATLALRYQLGLGGLLASLDEFAIVPDAPRGVERALRHATLGRRAALGAVRVLKEANQHTPPPRAAQLRARAAVRPGAAGLAFRDGGRGVSRRGRRRRDMQGITWKHRFP